MYLKFNTKIKAQTGIEGKISALVDR